MMPRSLTLAAIVRVVEIERAAPPIQSRHRLLQLPCHVRRQAQAGGAGVEQLLQPFPLLLLRL